ncbi:hypothetical protein MLD38_017589 [Melastoma candidum]|uniref:Uncharacterized protein n=1 Tax=Melastoma candidum TaxID=119954 RepID=A0ACB9QQJ5_9MYRT|nr:hypothetical protein MLD38_017589 [Melastoma candidum]
MELTLNGRLQRAEEAAGDVISIVQPHSLLPKPEAPPGSLLGLGSPGKVEEDEDEVPFRGLAESFRFLRDRSSSLSASIAKTLSAKVMALDGEDEEEGEEATEIDLKGLTVVARMKTEEDDDNSWKPEGEGAAAASLKGRISFYSRSNCRDCIAVRRFFREKGLKFIEINVNVFPSREKELIQRTGSSQVENWQRFST